MSPTRDDARQASLSRLPSTLQSLIPSHFPSLLSTSSPASLQDLAEAIDYVLTQCAEDAVPLPEATIPGEERAEVSIEEAESHPLSDLLASALSEILGLPLQPGQVPLLTSEVLEDLSTPEEDDDETEEEKREGGKKRFGECEICERQMGLTVHHLIPRSLRPHPLPPHLLGHPSNLAHLCRPCHSAVHSLIPDHKILAREYSSVERLLGHDGVRRWAGYASKQKEIDPRYGGIRLKHKR